MKTRKMIAILLAALCLAYPLSACGADDTKTADTSSRKSKREQAEEEEEKSKHKEDEEDEASSGDAADTTAATTAATTVVTTTTAAPLPAVTNDVPQTDDVLTIGAWTDDDLQYMIDRFESNHPEYTGKVEYKQIGWFASEAQEMYATYMAGDGDLDLFMTEAEWLRDYADLDDYTRSIYDLGFAASDFANCYKYTLQAGMNSDGDLRGVTWQAAPGCYAYRTDLAKEYLGVVTPDEMQMMVKDWNTFTDTAAVLAENSVKMVNSIGGMWTAWSYQYDAYRYTTYGYATSSDFSALEQYAQTSDHWYGTWFTNMQTDSVFGEFICSWFLIDGGVLSQLEGDSYVADLLFEGPTHGLFNICEGPNAFAWGGSYLLLSSKCNSGEIAHDFIYDFVVNSETMKEFAQSRGNNDFVNNSGVNKSLTNTTNPLLGNQSQFTILDAVASKISIQ